MKKLLSLLVLIAIAPFVLKAEVQHTMEMQIDKALSAQKIDFEQELPGFKKIRDAVEAQVMTSSEGYDTVVKNWFNSANPITDVNPDANIMTYEPISQTVSVLRSFNAVYSDAPAVGKIELFYTQDLGRTIGMKTIMEEQDQILPVTSSIATMNPDGTSDVDELEHVFVYRVREYDEATQGYPWSDGVRVHVIPSASDGNPYSFPASEPFVNNDAGAYKYSYGRMASYSDSESSYAYAVGSADVTNTIDFKSGPAYFLSVDMSIGDIDQGMMLPHYGEDVITYWSDNPDATTNSGDYIDTDENGNVYVLYINHLQPNHPENGATPLEKLRTIAFMKSSDNGYNWSEELVKYPNEKLISYMNSQGQDPSENYVPLGGLSAYMELGFSVTSEDNLTLVLPILIITGTTPEGATESEIVLTDFTYKDGVWQDPVPIHQLEVPAYHFMTLARSWDEQPMDTVRYRAGEGMEIELAKVYGTNGDLVLKFAQYTDDMIALDEPYDVKTTDGSQAVYDVMDTVRNVGIYGAARVNGSWNSVRAIVDDLERNESSAQMPSIVPSINTVPMLFSLGLVPDPEGEYKDHRTGHGAIVYDLLTDWWWRRYYYGTFNFGGVSVEDNQVVKSDVNMNVFPNPASNEAYVEYTSGDVNVRMEIFDALGNKVMSVLGDQMQNAGTKTAPINVSSLANGTYYVHLTVGNETFTKTLNVVR